jgi:hypothetical protein
MRPVSVIIVFLALLLPALVSAAGSGCLRCHGDEATMKSLFVPPKGGPSEGEG